MRHDRASREWNETYLIQVSESTREVHELQAVPEHLHENVTMSMDVPVLSPSFVFEQLAAANHMRQSTDIFRAVGSLIPLYLQYYNGHGVLKL